MFVMYSSRKEETLRRKSFMTTEIGKVNFSNLNLKKRQQIFLLAEYILQTSRILFTWTSVTVCLRHTVNVRLIIFFTFSTNNNILRWQFVGLLEELSLIIMMHHYLTWQCFTRQLILASLELAPILKARCRGFQTQLSISVKTHGF